MNSDEKGDDSESHYSDVESDLEDDPPLGHDRVILSTGPRLDGHQNIAVLSSSQQWALRQLAFKTSNSGNDRAQLLTPPSSIPVPLCHQEAVRSAHAKKLERSYAQRAQQP